MEVEGSDTELSRTGFFQSVSIFLSTLQMFNLVAVLNISGTNHLGISGSPIPLQLEIPSRQG